MFYVHLFLKAMYKKKLFCICKHLHTRGNTEAESRLRHEGDVRREGGLTGSELLNITRTTAGS